MHLSDWLTHGFVEDWINWPKYADYAKYTAYANMENMQNIQNMQNVQSMQNLQNKPTKPTCLTKPPNQIKPSLLNQTYQTKITGQSSQRLGP